MSHALNRLSASHVPTLGYGGRLPPNSQGGTDGRIAGRAVEGPLDCQAMHATTPPSFEDRAEVDAVALFLAHWRGALGAITLITLLVAFLCRDLVPRRTDALWCACACLAYLGQAAAALRMERAASLAQAMPRCLPWLMASIALGGVTWGMAPWLLSASSWQVVLFAGVLNLIVMYCVAISPGTAGMVWSAAVPLGVLNTAALLARADLQYVGLAIGVLFALVLVYGFRMQGVIRDAMVQRHAAADLAGALREHQQRLLALETERAVQQEREQIMRSMHDGLGATLVSALALAEHDRLLPGERAGVLRECLDDVRLVVDSLEQAEHDLATLLASLRYRWTPRLQASGLALQWSVDDLPPLPWLTPAAALQVLRIVQEAFANVIKHAQAKRLSVAVRVEPTCVRVLIEDDGVGFDRNAAAHRGRGLRHMPQRAAQLGGLLVIESRVREGTRVCLDLPLRLTRPATSPPRS